MGNYALAFSENPDESQRLGRDCVWTMRRPTRFASPRSSIPSARRTRWIVAAIEVVVGIGAVFGGYDLVRDAEGLGVKQSWLDGSPFSDYTVPGIFLLVVIGGGMLFAAATTLVAQRYAASVAGVMAVVLVLWGLAETAAVGWHGWIQLALLATFVAAPAIALAIFSVRASRQGTRA